MREIGREDVEEAAANCEFTRFAAPIGTNESVFDKQLQDGAGIDLRPFLQADDAGSEGFGLRHSGKEGPGGNEKNVELRSREHAEGLNFFANYAEGWRELLIGRKRRAGVGRNTSRIAMEEPNRGF